MTRKSLIYLFIVVAIGGNLLAQDRLATKANEKYEAYAFSPAIDIYQRLLDKGFVNADLLKRLGNSFYFNAEYRKAAEIYERLVGEYPTETGPEYYFRYAQTLRTLGNYERSKEVMAEFAGATSGDIRASGGDGTRDYLGEIKENSGRYELESFAYNSMYSDFAPSFYKQGLIFSSDRDTGNFARYRHTWNAKDFLDLYRVGVDSASGGTVKKFGDDINTRLHESTSVVTEDGKTLYFTRNNFKEGKTIKDTEGVIRLKIFKATLVDSIWTDVEELPFNSDSYSVAHPALSPDEKTLYFASDMPGTLGESDVFRVAILDDGTYGPPENLGSSINTAARETFPYLTEKEILYFSSDGHPGLGGLDVFATKISDGRFDRRVVNVGEPVNSPWDDFTFIFDENSRKGYFASNREEGMGADDIYGFLETIPLDLDCAQPITGTVRDKISNEVLVGATITVIDEQNQEVGRTLTDSEGKYSVALDCDLGNFVRASTQGYVPSEEYLAKSEGKPTIIDFYLEREKIIAGSGDDLAKLLQLSTIYFDYNKYNIRADSELEVEKVIAAMEKYPSLRIKVNSHTDSRGKDEYNLWLSQKRAEATVNYMISKGIAADRLQSEGYGETQLMNECVNGAACTEAEHELNRRSEFIILE